MALHVHAQILAAVASVLAAAGTDAATRVHTDRVDELLPDAMPAIVLELGDEQIDTITLHNPALQERTAAITVTACTCGASAAAAARELGKQIEVALFSASASTALSGLASAWRITYIRPALSGEGAQIAAQLKQEWLFAYTTRAGTPDAVA